MAADELDRYRKSFATETFGEWGAFFFELCVERLPEYYFDRESYTKDSLREDSFEDQRANGAANEPRPSKPTWRRDISKLFWGTQVIRRVRSGSVAKNVLKVLDAFEEEGWPNRIDDPLDPSKDQQRLHEAVKRLNDNLTRIRFRTDGRGEGIIWELD